MRLKDQLPKLMDAILVSNPYCNHADPLWSLNVTEKINNPVKEILNKIDDLDWSYSGPNPSMTVVSETDDVKNRIVTDKIFDLLSSLKNNTQFLTNLDYFAKHLDEIIKSTMPQPLNDTNVEDFKRERNLQKILFGYMINFFKTSNFKMKYGNLKRKFTNEISDFTNNITTAVLTGVNKNGILPV